MLLVGCATDQQFLPKRSASLAIPLRVETSTGVRVDRGASLRRHQSVVELPPLLLVLDMVVAALCWTGQ